MPSDRTFAALRRGAAALLLSSVAACGWLTPYRIDIQQGNVVEAAQLESLRSGLTRDQVRFLLGTPLLTDPFHARRWDYVYTIDRRSGGRSERAHLALFFDDKGLLERWQADVPPGDGNRRASRVIDLSTMESVQMPTARATTVGEP
jgi:outer membrane protein assembly factor BamE